jgi:hypothetical protein
MTKIRYSRVRLPVQFRQLAELCVAWTPEDGRKLKVIKSTSEELVLKLTAFRTLQVTEIMNDEPVVRTVSTVDQQAFRLFEGRAGCYLALLNPGRGSGAVETALEEVLTGQRFLIEPLEITPNLIARHTAKFAAARLVSAKVRDFKVYDNAVGRLEITSKSGLPPEIAPFLRGAFHRIEAQTFEVTHEFVTGLVWYSTGGTIRVSGPLVQKVFPLFEDEL